MGDIKQRLYRMRVYPVDINTPEVEWVAEIPDLPGCTGSGDTPEEAIAMARDAQKGWIEIALAQGKFIPEPTNLDDTEYSGKFTLRLPKTLHKDLAIQAQDEGVSLNQYLLYLISKGLYNQDPSVTKEEQGGIYKIEVNSLHEHVQEATPKGLRPGKEN